MRFLAVLIVFGASKWVENMENEIFYHLSLMLSGQKRRGGAKKAKKTFGEDFFGPELRFGRQPNLENAPERPTSLRNIAHENQSSKSVCVFLSNRSCLTMR
jgi:hypothetical protein